MFVRPCWRPRDDEESYCLVDDNPWALVVSNGDDTPFVTNLPLLLDRGRGRHGVLVGHIARANAHARVLAESGRPALAVFEGPWSYVTPSWYPDRDMPGTFYYSAVHCSGPVRIQSEAELDRWVRVLSDRMEAGIEDGWRTDEIAPSEIARRLPAIMGFEIEIERLEAKLKLGQDEPLRDAMAVADHLAASDERSHRQLAAAVRRSNSGREGDGSP